MKDAAGMFLIQKEIIFYTLSLQYFIADMNEKNENVIKFFRLFDFDTLKKVNNFIYLKLTQAAFQKGVDAFVNHFLPDLLKTDK